MYRYFARLYEKYDVPVYPIVVFSYDRPLRQAPNTFEITFPNKEILKFNYEVIQLNQLDWHDFVSQSNPIASALMAKMNIAPQDRPRVKLECLRMLVGLDLSSAQTHLISGFVDTYLRLNESEQQTFDREIVEILPPENREEVMEIVTSWMEEGIKRGLVQGRQEGRQEGRHIAKIELLVNLLNARFTSIGTALEAKIANLSDADLNNLTIAQLNFSNLLDLANWLDQHQTTEI